MATLVKNRKAGFNYEFVERLSAGIELLGFEVKSLKNGQGSLEGAYVIIRGGEAFLVGSTVPAYQPGNTPRGYNPMRNRRLLLTRKEISSLIGLEHQKNLTIVPLSVYNKGNLVKVEIAVAKGKKLHDKRETIKGREAKRDIARTLKYS